MLAAAAVLVLSQQGGRVLGDECDRGDFACRRSRLEAAMPHVYGSEATNSWGKSCTRLEGPFTAQLFKKYLSAGEPVVFSQAGSGFDERMLKWADLDHMVERFGSTVVEASVFDSRIPETRMGITPNSTMMVAPFIERVALRDMLRPRTESGKHQPGKVMFAEVGTTK